MAKELAFVIINPYPIRKSRTGGIIARYLVRTDLKLVGARIIGASAELAEQFATYLETYDPSDPEKCALFSAYVRRVYTPDAATGRPHRSMLLLFEGEDAIRKIFEVTGSIRQQWCSGQSVRDTYGDLVRNPATDQIEYFEPAVLVGASRQVVSDILRMWLPHLSSQAGIVRGALDVPGGADAQETLVMLKPDNWHQPSLRAGNIMDLLSNSGLRIVGVKKFSMSVAQAEEFYGPVREGLKKVFKKFAADRAAQALSREFGFPVDVAPLDGLCDTLAPLFADREFENIVEFMTGRRPSNCLPEERTLPGTEECLAIVYEGLEAVTKIREILGATDPTKARPGSIRREFGTNIMVNAAHASDSVENARREMRILDVANDPHFEALIKKYYLD
ncbi:MAG: nucleoside-diphosphate kinase [Kiritimatiellia bacterium]|jgi:nucleoside diphosphate kinase|nr:nucleoside-diphosphate kinase [Kiritimatiellia bacterium]MDD4440546.1 nucleoside-diphosphate kinase [Kiritimatiellia bacterium]MDX9792317.1 nucleoside-diphosphate kinase [Kiritimatiellia bacterium]NLC82305.1 nucleoside-diphosphate kinase [Lentisphaerota bacterium]